ncbi:MAG: hypothetical protein FJ118_14635 [Deltaproteobacteria bacterium]|nr:hypothetical protein [Deltaproteobacteria bacterium]
MTPVLVEVITPTLSSLKLDCRACGVIFSEAGVHQADHAASCDEYPPDWREIIMRLSEAIDEISRLYRHRVRIKFIDAQSPLGLWKLLRHRIRQTPAFVVDGRNACAGWDTQHLESLIDARLKEAPV